MSKAASSPPGGSLERQIGPLLATGRRLGCRHLSLFGSAAGRQTRETATAPGRASAAATAASADIDLHLVIARMDRPAFTALAASAEETAAALAAPAGRAWRVELRHGPFKPAPVESGAAQELQLHLLLDDGASLARSPCALLAHRAATGRLLAGEPLLEKRTDCGSAATWRREARVELTRWREALAACEIAFRHWVLDPEPHLAEARMPAATPWELTCLLRGAARAVDLHYRAALWIAPGTPQATEAAEDLARPLLSQLGEESPWQALAERWQPVSEQALTLIDRRLDYLARLCGVRGAASLC